MGHICALASESADHRATTPRHPRSTASNRNDVDRPRPRSCRRRRRATRLVLPHPADAARPLCRFPSNHIPVACTRRAQNRRAPCLCHPRRWRGRPELQSHLSEVASKAAPPQFCACAPPADIRARVRRTSASAAFPCASSLVTTTPRPPVRSRS